MDWLKKRQVTSQIIPPINSGGCNGNTHLLLEIHKTTQLAWKRYKLAQAATKRMVMHTFKDYHHSLELQHDDNRNIAGYTAVELFDHLNEPLCPMGRCGGPDHSTAEDPLTRLRSK